MIYLDNAATTKPKYFAKKHRRFWLNTNTIYSEREQRAFKKAEQTIRECLHITGGFIFPTRSATDSVEWLTKHFDKDVCVCDNSVHNAVFDNCVFFGVNYIKESDSYLLFHSYINQVTGYKQPIPPFFRFFRSINERRKCKIFSAVDLTAAIGKTELNKKIIKYADALFWSGHKFGCEKGIGGIWVSDRLLEYMKGKSSYKNMHDLLHGTVALPSFMAMAEAMKHAVKNIERKERKYKYIYNTFINALRKNQIPFSELKFEIPKTYSINAVEIKDVSASALQQWLAQKKIYIGTGGSACDEEEDYRVLKWHGVSKERARSFIRISFNEHNKKGEVKRLAKSIKKFKKEYCAC